MRPCPRSLLREAVLALVAMLTLAVASCVPASSTLPPLITTPLPEQGLTAAPSLTVPLASNRTPATADITPTPAAGTRSATTAPGPRVTSATGQTLYEDPSGRFTVPVPINWKVESPEGFLVLRDPEDAIEVRVVVVPGEDAGQAIAAAWATVNPSFKLAAVETAEEPSLPGIDETVTVAYDAGGQRTVLAVGQRVKDRTYVLLFDARNDAVARRSSQLRIIQSGLTIAGTEQVDLTNVRPRTLTPELLAELEAYIKQAVEQAHIAGASVAVVQSGQVTYLKGFGVRELGGDQPVTPDTLMMIGSVGKTMTTMMMATLVDEGLMAWDTPAVEILPSFAVADRDLTQRITMRNLVCACSGVPRRDLEFLFNANSLTAEDVVASLRDFDFFTSFGEAWQYSNQMVASGGYLAGLAGSRAADDMYSAYIEQMQRRVFEPVGMSHTTFSFEEVTAAPDYATPHGANLAGEYSPLPLSAEKLLIPVSPAGASWSSARDMARYLITELNEGVNLNGVRVVSAENLAVTWEPQVPVNADSSYGLGWYVSEYKGLHLLHHGGNTAGFTADLAFMPAADLGMVVLTNARGSTAFNEAIRFRLFELAFGQPVEHDAQFRFGLKEMENAKGMSARLKPTADAAQVRPYLGSFTNPALGDINLSMAGGRLMLDAGEFTVELRPRADEAGIAVFMADGTPLTGRAFEFRESTGADGKPAIVLLSSPDNYTFTRK